MKSCVPMGYKGLRDQDYRVIGHRMLRGQG